MTYIYCLIDPPGGHHPNEPRYVGKANDPEDRLYGGHLSDSGLQERNHKVSWLKSLLSKNLKPRLHILQRIPDGYHETWEEAERKWIMLFRLMGYHLTNETDGGDGGRRPGFSHSEVTRKRIGDGHRGVSKPAVSKANRSRVWQQSSLGKLRDRVLGDKNPMKDPEVAARCGSRTRGKPRPWMIGNKLGWKNRGKKDPPEVKATKSKAASRSWADPVKKAERVRKTWETRRRLKAEQLQGGSE